MAVKSKLQQAGDGTAIPAGFVGQKVTWSVAPSNFSPTTSESDWTNATFTLTPGVWEIKANLMYKLETGATSGNDVAGRFKLTDSTNATVQNIEKFARVKTVANVVNTFIGSVSFCCVESITANKTYKIRAQRDDNNGTNDMTVYNQAALYSEFYAIRIA